ncbi:MULTISPECIES: ROK family protein [unclassified Streptomyces]|uniref:ROK family protein n=1 Tax=unclassified Streptomyces TaxID=2593676 RepID=UPI0036EDDD9C
MADALIPGPEKGGTVVPAAEPVTRTARRAGGATSDDLRRQNLARLLGIVHRSNGLIRADLTRRTGLNRSTVGVCLTDLVQLGAVEEGLGASATGKGRPSPVITPAPDIVALTVNPEVDAITVGLVGLGGQIRERWRVETEQRLTVKDVVDRTAAAVRALLSGRALRVAGLAVAVPGQVRSHDGHVRDAVQLGWHEEPLATALADATGLPVRAANAAALGLSGEVAFGAGRGIEDLVYFIGGASGIGGGVVCGGRILQGSAGYGGELGHFYVGGRHLACPCGASGCLESEVLQHELLEALGLRPHEADQLDAALARSDDPAVRELVRRDLELLGIAVRQAVNVFNPARVVLGGFLAPLYRNRPPDTELGGDAIRASRESVRVAAAELGADQLIIGTAELAFAALLDDPAGHPPTPAAELLR